jgi:hypothetical protein
MPITPALAGAAQTTINAAAVANLDKNFDMCAIPDRYVPLWAALQRLEPLA